MESGTNYPLSIHFEIVWPTSGFLVISFLSNDLVHTCTSPYLLAITDA